MHPKDTTVVVTGASAGIGAAAATELIARGYRVLAVGRDAQKLARRGTPGLVADFTELAQVRRLAADLRPRGPLTLFHNAGVVVRGRELTGDGHEMTMQVNHLAPFLLTALLREQCVRVVTTASLAHARGRLDPGDLDGRGGWGAYCASKQANILFTRELARRHPELSPTCFHPGVVRSDLGRGGTWFGVANRTLGRLSWRSPEQGAATGVQLLTAPAAELVPGGYYADGMLSVPDRRASDDELAARLWEASAAALGLSPAD